MDEKARAFDVAEEAIPRPAPLVCAFDEAGKIGGRQKYGPLGAVARRAPVGVDDP